MKLKVGALALLAVFLGSSFSAAQTTTYNASWNASSGNWNAADWLGLPSGTTYPNNTGSALYDVTIEPASGATITLNQGITISDLTIGSTATLQAAATESLTLVGTSGVTPTLTNSGNLYFNNGGDSLIIQTGGLTNNGSMVFYGTSAGSATLNVTGTTTNSAGATISLEGTSGFGTTANFTGAVNNYGIFETGLFGGNDTLNVSGTFTNNSGGTLNLDSTDTVTLGVLSNSGTVIVGPSAKLYVGSGLTTIKAGSTLTVDGSFYITDTTKFALASLSTIYGTLELNDGASNTINNGLTIESGGALYLSNPAASSTTLTVSGAVTNFGLVSTGFAGGTNTLKVTDAFTNEAGATLQLAGTNDSVSVGSITNSGTITIGAGDTLNITGTSGLTSVASGSILNISGSFTLGSNTTNPISALAGMKTVSGQLDLDNGSLANSISESTVAFTINPGGSINLSDTAATTTELTITAADGVTNEGAITTGFSGGKNTIDITGNLTNTSTGQIDIDGHSDALTVSGTITNSGSMTIKSASTVTAGSSYSQTATAGSEAITVDGTLKATSMTITYGSVYGSGTIVADVTVGKSSGTSGTFNVGDSGLPGLLAITGTYTQKASAIMNLSIGGGTAGTQFSQLQIGSTATLAGNLTVALVNGFTPTLNETFIVLTASSISTHFTTTTITVGSDVFSVNYESGTTDCDANVSCVVLEVTSTGSSAKHRSLRTTAKKREFIADRFKRPLNLRLRRPILVGQESNAFARGFAPGSTAALWPRIWDRVSTSSANNPARGTSQMPAIAHTGAHDDLLRAADIRGNSALNLHVPLAGVRDGHRAPIHIVTPMLPHIGSWR